MRDAYFLPATVEHAEELAAHMQQWDVREVYWMGQTPIEAVRESMASSEVSLTLLLDGRVAAMFGVGPWCGETLLGCADVGWTWLLTSQTVKRRKLDFVKCYRLGVRLLLGLYPRLLTFIDADYVQAIRLAGLAGFIADSRLIRHPQNGHPFVPVSARRKSWAQ